jgi:ABC-type nitrate/sulfonate/bicarbonate transport system substrate-binding protein
LQNNPSPAPRQAHFGHRAQFGGRTVDNHPAARLKNRPFSRFAKGLQIMQKSGLKTHCFSVSTVSGNMTA